MCRVFQSYRESPSIKLKESNTHSQFNDGASISIYYPNAINTDRIIQRIQKLGYDAEPITTMINKRLVKNKNLKQNARN